MIIKGRKVLATVTTEAILSNNAFFVKNEHAYHFRCLEAGKNADIFYEPARYDLKVNVGHRGGYGVWQNV